MWLQETHPCRNTGAAFRSRYILFSSCRTEWRENKTKVMRDNTSEHYTQGRLCACVHACVCVCVCNMCARLKSLWKEPFAKSSLAVKLEVLEEQELE